MATVGLIGDPVAHSVSPAMQNAAFAAVGLPHHYVLWHTPAEQMAARVAALRAADMLGANVTIPHKEAAAALVDQLDPVAAAVGAVNTIVRGADDRLHGFNTDVQGFIRALATAAFDPSDRAVVLLGAGGAARAVAYGLVTAGARSLTVINRTRERAERLLADVLATTEADPRLWALEFDDPAAATASIEADLVVNATSVGLDGAASPVPAAWIRPQTLVVDLIYHDTPLLRQAAQRGARIQNGVEMLVQQGALAFELWTGQAPPIEQMRAAAQQALKERT